MKVDKERIEHVASLAKLKLSEEEIERFTWQLKEVFETFSKLNEVDTKDALPSFQPVALQNALRSDEPKDSLSQEDALSNTIHKKEGYFKGPKVV